MERLIIVLLGLLVAGCAKLPQGAAQSNKETDAAFARLADEYIAGYLAWRPQTGTALGFHQYDGKVTDFSQASLDAELARLKSFDQRLSELDVNQLSPQASYDFRILRNAIKREIFGFEQM